MKTLTFKTVLYGILSWLVPFLLAFVFYKPDGELSIDKDLFKSVMVVISLSTSLLLLSILFRNIQSDFLMASGSIGLTWLILNLVLDVLILLPMSSMTMTEYINSIGVRYLSIPIVCLGMGYNLYRRSKP